MENKFKEYFEKNPQESQAKLAERADISASYLSRIISGEVTNPTVKVVFSIQKATKNFIKAKDWV